MIRGVKGKLGTVGEKNPQNVSNSDIHAQLVHSHGFDLKSKQNSDNIYLCQFLIKCLVSPEKKNV